MVKQGNNRQHGFVFSQFVGWKTEQKVVMDSDRIYLTQDQGLDIADPSDSLAHLGQNRRRERINPGLAFAETRCPQQVKTVCGQVGLYLTFESSFKFRAV